MFKRKRSRDDFAEEIKAHLELEADELKREGLSEDEARRRERESKRERMSARTLPNSSLAFRRASSSLKPSRFNSSASSSRCALISSAKSSVHPSTFEHGYASLPLDSALPLESIPLPSSVAPTRSSSPQAATAFRCQGIEPRLAVVLAHSPLCADPLLFFEPLQGQIKRTMVDKKTSSDWPCINRATPWPWHGPSTSVFRISRSSVPCNKAIRSSAFFWVAIRPKDLTVWVGCQHEL